MQIVNDVHANEHIFSNNNMLNFLIIKIKLFYSSYKIHGTWTPISILNRRLIFNEVILSISLL